jgi:uncharacterized protein
MPDEKDRFGEKLKEVEKGREDQFFAQRDRELIEKMKREKDAEQEVTERAAARMRCPKCGAHLEPRVLHDITIEECSGCGGMWLDQGELEELARRESEGWLGRVLRSRLSR